jgi:hypothetical protein
MRVEAGAAFDAPIPARLRPRARKRRSARRSDRRRPETSHGPSLRAERRRRAMVEGGGGLSGSSVREPDHRRAHRDGRPLRHEHAGVDSRGVLRLSGAALIHSTQPTRGAPPPSGPPPPPVQARGRLFSRKRKEGKCARRPSRILTASSASSRPFELAPVHVPGHHDVGQQQIELVCVFKDFESGFAARSFGHSVAKLAQNLRRISANRVVILDDKNALAPDRSRRGLPVALLATGLSLLPRLRVAVLVYVLRRFAICRRRSPGNAGSLGRGLDQGCGPERRSCSCSARKTLL